MKYLPESPYFSSRFSIMAVMVIMPVLLSFGENLAQIWHRRSRVQNYQKCHPHRKKAKSRCGVKLCLFRSWLCGHGGTEQWKDTIPIHQLEGSQLMLPVGCYYEERWQPPRRSVGLRVDLLGQKEKDADCYDQHSCTLLQPHIRSGKSFRTYHLFHKPEGNSRSQDKNGVSQSVAEKKQEPERYAALARRQIRQEYYKNGSCTRGRDCAKKETQNESSEKPPFSDLDSAGEGRSELEESK